MKKETVYVALCNQKGGVGKSAMTILLAGYYHYLKGLNVAVVDCDYPQFSLVRMKERDMRTVEHSEYFKQLMVSQFERIKKKAYTIVGSKAENARQTADELAAGGDYDRGSARNGKFQRGSQYHCQYGLRADSDCSGPDSDAEQSVIFHNRPGLYQGNEGYSVERVLLFLDQKGCPCFNGSIRRLLCHYAQVGIECSGYHCSGNQPL